MKLNIFISKLTHFKKTDLAKMFEVGFKYPIKPWLNEITIYTR